MLKPRRDLHAVCFKNSHANMIEFVWKALGGL